MRSRRFVLPAVMAAVAALAPALGIAPTANAVDTFTCKTSAPIFDVRSDGGFHLRHNEEPETGGEVWSATAQVGAGWPVSTYAGPNNKVYFITAGGELRYNTWLGTTWKDQGVSKLIDTSDTWKIYNTNPAFHKRFTIDSRGDFYYIDSGGTLRMKRYNETTNAWNELFLDAGWNQYDAIVAAGEGVLWARTPAGDVFRYRFHAASQRWVSRGGRLAGGWNAHSLLFSPGADIIYAVHGQQRSVWWYRYIESENRFVQGSGSLPAGSGWAADSVAATASPDTCAVTGVTPPETPTITVEVPARSSLLRTSDGALQYSYVDNERKLVHARIQDVTSPGPSGFEVLPGYTAFTGSPTMSENENGLLRVYGHGGDTNVHGFLQMTGGWNPHANFAGQLLSAPQLVRTANKLQTMVAFNAGGALWLRPQRVINGGMHAWRRPGGRAPLAPGTKDFTALTTGDTIIVVARNTDGRQCRASITALEQTEWQCSSTNGFTSAAAVVTMPDNTLQLFARKADGTVHTTRTAADGTIPDVWTPVPGALPSGVVVAGAPAALLAPNGTLQVAVRGSDGFTYRTGQTSSASTSWHPWSEIQSYLHETAVDPAMSLAGDTWVIAYRTPSGDPKMVRWQPTQSSAARTASETGELVEVPLHR